MSRRAVSRRRTSSPQHRARASEAAMQRRLAPSAGRRISGPAQVGIAVLLLGLAGAAVIYAFALLANSGTANPVGTHLAEIGRTHIPEGTDGGPYNSTPATSGPHWPSPTAWGVHAGAVPEAQSIHNLEHGGVVIWYEPSRLSADAVDELILYTQQQNATVRYKVILSPWAGTDFGHPIAMTAWTWVLYLDAVDTDALDGFIDAHYGQAPEPNGGPGPPGT